MSSLSSRLESLLFIASKALSVNEIARSLDVPLEEVTETLAVLQTKFNHEESVIHIAMNGSSVQMQTNPAHAQDVERFVKYEISGELTKAQLESLTIVAYRGPISRPELEQIRGVNCAVILRNLLMRGLIDEHEDEKKVSPVYSLSMEAVRHLGVNSASELPDYSTLHKHEHLENALQNVEARSK